MSGMEDLVIAGGTEMMSMTATLRDGPGLHGQRQPAPARTHPQPHQGICADAIATLEGIARADLDALALESQQRAAVAIAEGRFSKSLIPVFKADGTPALDHEEFPRPQTTAEGLASLKPAFATLADHPLDDRGTTFRGLIRQKYPDLDINFVHHAGNSSGVVDGAAALLLASPTYAKAHGLKPRARVVAMANVGDSRR
jgi:acetyl-CoA C-acetyltransferase